MATHASSSDYHPGDMDIHEQVHTWTMFKKLSKWASLAFGVGILFLVLWFCTPAGFLGGLVVGVVVTAIGVMVLRDKVAPAH